MKSVKALVVAAFTAVVLMGFVSCGDKKVANPTDLSSEKFLAGNWELTAKNVQDYKAGEDAKTYEPYNFTQKVEIADGKVKLSDEKFEIEVEINEFLKEFNDYMFSAKDKDDFNAAAKEAGVEVKYEGDETLVTNKKDLIKYSATMSYESETEKLSETKTIEMKKIK